MLSLSAGLRTILAYPAYIARYLLGYVGLPRLARPAFRYELIGSLLTCIGGSLLLSEFISIFATNAMGAQKVQWVTAVLVAEGAVGNFFAAFIAPYLQRQRRIPFIVIPQILIAGVLASLALLPASPEGLIPLVVLLAIPPLLGSVVTNVFSQVWHSNYPQNQRGAIFARLQVVRLLVGAGAVFAAGSILDHWPHAYRVLYPIGAGTTLAGAYFLSKIRVRGERAALRRGQLQRIHPLASFRVLWEDRDYGRYMLWQMISGGSLLMTAAVMVKAIKDTFGLTYTDGAASMILVPMGVQMVSVTWAGRLFDRVPITIFRGINAGIWAASRGALLVGLLLESWAVVYLGFALQGLASSTGGVGWNIGHTKFAPPDKSQLYMAIHLTLQGIRGLTLPFLGAWLYGQIGLYVILAGVLAQVVAAVEFTLGRSPKQTA